MFANEREWSLHNAVLHYKPATSFGGPGSKRKRESEKNNDDDNESGNDDDGKEEGGDSSSWHKRTKLIWEKVESAGSDTAANRPPPAEEHTSARVPPTDGDEQSRHEEQPQEAPDGQRPSTSSPVPAGSSPALSLSLSQSPLSQPGAEQLTEVGEADELSAAGLSRADLEASEREELRLAQERSDREMAERMQTEEAERVRDLESDRKLAEALQERDNEHTGESEPGEGPSGGRPNTENCQSSTSRINAVEVEAPASEIGEPEVSSNGEMNREVDICGPRDVEMADAPPENVAQESAMDSEPASSTDYQAYPEGEGPNEQDSTTTQESGTNSVCVQTHARKSDEEYNASTLPRELFRCYNCDPPQYFVSEALNSEDIIKHMMETNHLTVKPTDPLTVLKKFNFRDPWIDQE